MGRTKFYGMFLLKFIAIIAVLNLTQYGIKLLNHSDKVSRLSRKTNFESLFFLFKAVGFSNFGWNPTFNEEISSDTQKIPA